MDTFNWSPESEKAVELVAQGELTNVEIADKCGVSRMTLWRWSQHPDFKARVDGILDEYRSEVRRKGLAIIDRRINALNDRWLRMNRVMEARASDPEVQGVPGADSGLLVRTFKQIGRGDKAQLVKEYAVDGVLLRELREHEKQAAQELGQWVEKTNVDQNVKAYVGITPEDL